MYDYSHTEKDEYCQSQMVFQVVRIKYESSLITY